MIALDESTDDDADSLPIQVRSSEPIVVERGLYQRGDDQRGMSNALGVPSADGVRVPPDPLAASADEVDLGEVDDTDARRRGARRRPATSSSPSRTRRS